MKKVCTIPWPHANQDSRIVTICHLAYAQPGRGERQTSHTR